MTQLVLMLRSTGHSAPSRPEHASRHHLAQGWPVAWVRWHTGPMDSQHVDVIGRDPIEFTILRTRRGRPFCVPSRLPELPAERALATVVLPHWIDWSPPGRPYRLADRHQRYAVYQLVLNEGSGEEITRFIDGALLVELWPDLIVPAEIRDAWDPVVRAWSPSAA